ncbi:MAG: VanZ family protein [Bacteroidales bacterium]|nr:VanZ family protein [Bacteroidales bacterium]
MYLRRLIREVFAHAAWEHWVWMGILALALTGFLSIRKRVSVHAAVCLGLTLFAGLFLLDTAVLIRIGDGLTHKTGFDPAYELHYFLTGGMVRWTEMFANVVVFAPFGFFLGAFLRVTRRFGSRGRPDSMARLDSRRRLGLVALCSLGLSLCIEALQLLLRVGVFEVTDLVLNTLGGVGGAWLAGRLRGLS